ncbi:MAG: hypothetical protein R6V10_02080 [bacterium]
MRPGSWIRAGAVFAALFLSVMSFSSGSAGSYNGESFALSFCRKACREVSGVPGLSASELHRSFEIKSSEERYNTFLGADVIATEVKVTEDFQAIARHSKKKGLISLKPDKASFIQSPEWDESDKLYLESALWKKMESYGDAYKEAWVYYKKIGEEGRADKYRLRVRGEYSISLEVGQKENKFYFYQNDMALAGLETGKKLPKSLIQKNKHKWIKKMTGLIPLPEEGAELDTVDFSEWDKCGGGCKVQVAGISYKHMMGEGDQKTQYHGDSVLYMLNPKTGALFNYNRKWSDMSW